MIKWNTTAEEEKTGERKGGFHEWNTTLATINTFLCFPIFYFVFFYNFSMDAIVGSEKRKALKAHI